MLFIVGSYKRPLCKVATIAQPGSGAAIVSCLGGQNKTGSSIKPVSGGRYTAQVGELNKVGDLRTFQRRMLLNSPHVRFATVV